MEKNEYGVMRACEDSHWWYESLRQIWMRSLRERFRKTLGLKIADIGCGTGGNLAEVVNGLSAKGTGIDKSELALSLAANRFNGIALAQARAEALPLQALFFDAALFMDVLYIQGIEEEAALAEIYRVLKPGGYLLINLPAFECLRGEHDQAVHTKKRYRKSELGKLLNAAGFKIIKMSYWNFLFFPLIYLYRKSGRLFSARESCLRSDVRTPPRWLNDLLKGLLTAERFFFFRSGLPWGVSVFAIAQKPV